MFAASASDDSLSWPALRLGGTSLTVTTTLTMVLTLPTRLWHLYVEYLWDPAPGSWVSRTASTFRFLAYFVIAPFVLLTLLDVTSYVIARTLGVVETTRASTNDKVSVVIEELASVGVSAGAGRGGSDVSSEEEDSGKDEPGEGDIQFKMKIERDGTQQAPASDSSGPPAYFFSPTEEKNLDLSGANVLSPAVSRQGSPGIERRRRELLPVNEGYDADADAVGEAPGSASASTDSFAVVEVEQPSGDDAAAASGSGLRRRTGVSEENAATQQQET